MNTRHIEHYIFFLMNTLPSIPRARCVFCRLVGPFCIIHVQRVAYARLPSQGSDDMKVTKKYLPSMVTIPQSMFRNDRVIELFDSF